MLVLGSITGGCIIFIVYALQFRIIFEMVLSLFNRRVDERHPLYVFLLGLTEPFCKPFKRILPANDIGGMACIFAILTLLTCRSLIMGIFKELDKLM